MRAAFLANASAGSGAKLEAIGRRLKECAGNHTVLAAAGYGLGEFPGAVEVEYAGRPGFLPNLYAAVDALCQQEPDLYILAGGDGLCAYVADRLITRHGRKPAIFGVAMGTANVGPIITTDILQEPVRLDELTFESTGAVEVLQGGKHLCYGFNDIVIGNTLLSTLEGRTVTVSAEAMARDGSKILEDFLPDISAGEGVRVEKNGRPAPCSIAHPCQIVLSSLEHDDLYGRAVTGLLCHNTNPLHCAAMALCPLPIVHNRELPGMFDRFHAFDQLIFGPGDELCLTGLSSRAQVIADGNPYLRDGTQLCFRYAGELVRIAKSA